MSEYQYYEFQAIDRQLTDKEQAYIASLSRRVELTPYKAIFTYSYSDFPAEARSVLLKYFDALLYLANWGTRQLAFRFPRSVVDPQALKPYCFGDSVTVHATKNYVVLDILENDEEGGSWVEGEGWLPVLSLLRQDVMRGDFRVLYLAWLKAVTFEGYGEELEEDEDSEDGRELLEPPVPANLHHLSQALKTFIEFFDIDEDLIAAAAEASVQASAVAEQDIAELISRLTEQERNEFLVKLAKGEPNVDVQLTRRLQELSAATGKALAQTPLNRRTVAELLAAADEKARQRKERQRQKAEKERIKRLEELSKREPQVWNEVFELIEKKQSKAYEAAVKQLRELKELAAYTGATNDFSDRLRDIYEKYHNRSAFTTWNERM